MVPGTWVPAAPAGGPTSAAASSDDASTPWARGFASEISRLRSRGVTYAQSADFLREIVRRASLRFTDIRDDPRRFFLAHRLLAAHAPAHGPGFWIRFTVQFNLFAGTVVALGGPAHLRRLDAIQAAGELGCFCLTERLAGVNSGLVVNTTASYDPASRTFTLTSPNEGACKNWISQGLTAEWAVVVADLTTGGVRAGPHGFLVRIRDSRGGSPRRGVTVGDMGEKTTGLDLDNAWVRFTAFRVPHECLLNRHGGVDAATGAYIARGAGAKKPMEMIGQRLFTGRVAVAQAALVFSRTLFAKTRQYSDHKMCAMRGTTPALTDVPQLRALYDEADARFARMESFADACETELCAALASDTPPGAATTRAIAVAKIRAVEMCVELCHRLKQEVGSYALMADTGFEHADFLQCCKFAEGDSRILSQKLARDAFGEWLRHERKRSAGTECPPRPPGWSPEETRACARIAAAVKDAEERGASKIQAWDAAWRDVYALADAVCARAMAGTLGETLDAKL